jgi:tetratricopeptide (TPR) repeat protein
MKLLTILCVSLLLILPVTPQESPELKQALELNEAFVKLINEQKYNEALPLAKRALEIRERLLPRDDPLIGSSLIYLVHIYDSKRDYGKAKETLQRLLQYQTDRFGADHVKLAPTLERLAVLYYRDGDKPKAEDAYKRSLASKEKEYGMDHVEVAHTLFGLGKLYHALRDFEHASPVYRRALRIYGNRLGVSSAEFERTRDSYSCLGYATTKYDIFREINSIWQIYASPGGAVQADSGMILNGRAISLPKPVYSAPAREHRESGTVIVKVKIDETGAVVEAKDMCGAPPYISESSVKAAYQAHFTPTKLSGKPVPVYGVIQYNFVGR